MKPSVTLLLLVAQAAGCRGKDAREDATPQVATAPASATPPSSPSASPIPAEAWYAGSWTGTYQATAHRIELAPKQGGLPDWGVDDGKAGTGSGTLQLAARGDGTATGKASGPLGEQELRGAFDGDVLTARFVPGEASGYAGTLIARRNGEQIVGTLAASATDGRRARAASVTLRKSPP